MIHAVPEMFKPKIRVEYPPDNKQIFEEWFYENAYVQVQEPWIKRHYLPIFWTSFQVNNDYGKGRKMHDLQAYIDGLDRSKKYFTITQYDDGPLVDFKDLDIKVFGSGGGRIDVPIPLVCMKHPGVTEYVPPSERKYIASFIGSITHPIRQKMLDYLYTLSIERRKRYYISTEHHDISRYCEIMSQSTFALCPRGYGKTSFRICEAIQYKTIPVYISDEFIYPFNGPEDYYGLSVEESDIQHIDIMLELYFKNSIKYWDQATLKSLSAVDDLMYCYVGLSKAILGWLKHL